MEVAKKMSGRRYGEGMMLTRGVFGEVDCLCACYIQCLVWFLVNWISKCPAALHSNRLEHLEE